MILKLMHASTFQHLFSIVAGVEDIGNVLKSRSQESALDCYRECGQVAVGNGEDIVQYSLICGPLEEVPWDMPLDEGCMYNWIK